MPWFKVDDGFHGHPKVVELSVAAIGVWTVSGSWCAQYLTDGEITMKTVRRLGGEPELVEELVAAGLWEETVTGYRFHDWLVYQPAKVSVEGERTAARDRMRDLRAAKKGVRPNTSRTDAERSSEQPENFGARSDEVRSAPALSQSPSQSQSPEDKDDVHRNDARSSVLDAEFAEFWEVYPRKQGKAEAAKAFRLVRKNVAQKTILEGVQAYALLNLGADKTFLKLPAGWLRGERWDDERIGAEAHALEHRVTATTRPFIDERPVAQMPPRASEVTGFCERHTEYPQPCDRCHEERLESGVA
jgi:hypothetical protein